MIETTTKPSCRNTLGSADASIKRVSNVEESLNYLRSAIANLEDITASLSIRLTPVLSSTSVPSAVSEKSPAYGVPLADALQQLTIRVGVLNHQLHDLNDRLGV